MFSSFELAEQEKASRGLRNLRANSVKALLEKADKIEDPVAAFHFYKRAADVQSLGAASNEGSAWLSSLAFRVELG